LFLSHRRPILLCHAVVVPENKIPNSKWELQ